MVADKKYKYWLAVVDGDLVRFSDLAHMMAIALHPGADESISYAAARINLGEELKLAVRDGLLRVRNPAGLGFHTFPHGDALQRAVLMPNIDLEPFLNARGIELRITPYGNGPIYWTLENAALEMQTQLNWHSGTRAEFLDQMQDAAVKGLMEVLDPRTCLPARSPEQVRTYWEYLTPDRVNNWLATLNAPYRWNVAPPLLEVPHTSPRDFRPWETLVPFFEPIKGVFMYQQAAREIADAEHWDDAKLVALEAEMLCAINDHSLPVRDRKTGMEVAHDVWDELKLVTVEDVNTWLVGKRVPYRWKLRRNANEPQPGLQESESFVNGEYGNGFAELPTYQLADLEPILPFTNCSNQTFLGKAEACGELVEYWATEAGLWLYVPENTEVDFKVTTGFRKTELERKLIGGVHLFALRDGSPVLPFPFTAAQLLALDKRAGGVFAERIDCGGDTEAVIAELSRHSPRTAELARAVLYGVIPPNVQRQPEPQGYPKVLHATLRHAGKIGTAPVLDETTTKPWLLIDPKDPAPAQPWYTPARYFARQLVIEKPTLLSNRELLAEKVSALLFNAGLKKRGGKLKFDSGTVLKAFANVILG